MGQAKLRGTFEQRKAESIARNRQKAKMEVEAEIEQKDKRKTDMKSMQLLAAMLGLSQGITLVKNRR